MFSDYHEECEERAHQRGVCEERRRAAKIIRGLIDCCSDFEIYPDGSVGGAITERESELLLAAAAYLKEAETE